MHVVAQKMKADLDQSVILLKRYLSEKNSDNLSALVLSIYSAQNNAERLLEMLKSRSLATVNKQKL